MVRPGSPGSAGVSPDVLAPIAVLATAAWERGRLARRLAQSRCLQRRAGSAGVSPAVLAPIGAACNGGRTPALPGANRSAPNQSKVPTMEMTSDLAVVSRARAGDA